MIESRWATREEGAIQALKAFMAAPNMALSEVVKRLDYSSEDPFKPAWRRGGCTAWHRG